MKGVVRHIGLPWDPNIMNYNKLNRVVQTHSQSQVRLKVYNSSIGSWRKFQTELKPLIKITKKHMKRLKSQDLLPYPDMNWGLDSNYIYPYDKPKVIDDDINNGIDNDIGNDIDKDIDNNIDVKDKKIKKKNKDKLMKEEEVHTTGDISNDIDILEDDIDIDSGSSTRKRKRRRRRRRRRRFINNDNDVNDNEDDIDNNSDNRIKSQKNRKKKIISTTTTSFNDDDSDIVNNIIDVPEEINKKENKILKLKKKKQSKESLLERFENQYYDSVIDIQYIDSYINSLKRKNINPSINKLIAYGYFFVNQGQFSTSFSLFNNMLKYFSPLQNISEIDRGSLINVYMGLGSAQALSGKLKESIATFNKLIDLDEFNIEGLTRRSEILAANNDLILAELDLNQIMGSKEYIDSHELVHSRGSIRFRLRKFHGAYQDFKQALNIVLIKISTSHSIKYTTNIKKLLKLKLSIEEKNLLSNIYNYMGKCEKEFGNYSKIAINSQLTSLKYVPDMKESYLDLAIAKMDTLQWNESFKYFNKTIELDENITNIYGFRGNDFS
jgi:tetratricopeptide (TPR) repeat protein